MSEYTNPLPSLQKLSLREQAAFALACAIRIGALGEEHLSKKAIDLCERVLLTTQKFIATGDVSSDLQAQSNALESLDELDDDRVAAAAYLLRHIISRESENAAWVAQRASDACGFLVDRAIEKGISNERIERIPQDEFQYQQRDLESLLGQTSCPIEIVENARRNAHPQLA